MGNPAKLTLLLTLAAIAHEANRHYCRSIGDNSQPAWDDAPEWQRESAVNGIEGALNGFTPEQSHESWMAEKVATGWKFGPVKDPEAKEHPCMVPYAELPPEQRRKDALYLAVVKAAAGVLAPQPNPAGQAGGVQKATIGRVVHYVAYGTPGGEFKPAHRAAVVTEVHPDHPATPHAQLVKVCVLNPQGIFFSDWLPEDPSGERGGTWHWPERE